jgi:AcrR family transcriptional regulator
MTDKKEKILRAALELFAEEGFKPTSTNKIAKRAGVSEGLIFRHFGNKDGLLEAIIQEGEEQAKVLFADIVMESDPKEVLKKYFNLSYKLMDNPDMANFWKLQYKIKWELEIYGEHKMEPLELALSNAFKKLDYENPELEARFVLVYMDGLATRFYLQKGFNIADMVEYFHAKYKQ